MAYYRKNDGTELVPVMTEDRLYDLDSRDFSLDDIDVRRKAERFRQRSVERDALKLKLKLETDIILKQLGLARMPTLDDIRRHKKLGE